MNYLLNLNDVLIVNGECRVHVHMMISLLLTIVLGFNLFLGWQLNKITITSIESNSKKRIVLQLENVRSSRL